MIARAGATLALGLLVACAPTRNGRIGGGFATSSGDALAPAGVASGRTNAIVIHDIGGPLSRLTAIVVGVVGASLIAGQVDVKSERKVTETDFHTVTETTTTTTIGVDASKLDEAGSLLTAATAIATDENVPIETTLAIASRDLGGDTAGFRFESSLRLNPGAHGGAIFRSVRFSVGLAFGKLTFHDRPLATLAANPDTHTIVAQTNPATTTWDEFGFPIRFEGWIARPISIYAQADLNWVTLVNTIEGTLDAYHPQEITPSPMRYGVRLWLGPLAVDGQLVTNGFDTRTRTWTAEATLVF